MRKQRVFWVVYLLLSVAPMALPAPVAPDELDGLVAWFTVDSLHSKLRDGEHVKTWRDSSGNGHDLVDDANGSAAVFRTVAFNGQPLVQIGKLNSHSVTEPFELADHTIVLVYASKWSNRALFRSGTKALSGLSLNQDGKLHQYQSDRTRRVVNYNVSTDLPNEFNITVLGRESGVLKAFVNGVDRSSNRQFAEPIPVGKFFSLKRTQFVVADGNGLKIAEIAIYDRFLDEAERTALQTYLSREYSIELQAEPAEPHTPAVPARETVQLWLSTGNSANLNREAVAVEWDSTVKLEPPFYHDPEDNSRLYCTNKRTRARLFVSLPMRTAVPGVRVRVLLLKNDEEYQPMERVTESFEGEAGDLRSTVQFATTVNLSAGDFVQVITVQQGEDGVVSLIPAKAILTAEVR